MLPIGPLMVEHRLIERVIDDAQLRVKEVYARKAIDPQYVSQVVDFMETYADRCHHGKEENILFRALAIKAPSEAFSVLMDKLEEQHEAARATVRKLVAANAAYLAGVEGSEPQVRQLLKELAIQYIPHIQEEDKEFYGLAMTYFSPTEQTAMLAEFRDYDRSLIHEKYRRVVDGLEAER